MAYDGDERREKHWHLERSVSIGHIITTLAVASSIMVWAMKMDTRVSVIEAEYAHTKENAARIEKDWREGLKDVKEVLIRIEGKIENKADKK